MSNPYNHEFFNVVPHEYISCWTTDTRNGFCHHAQYVADGAVVAYRRCSYLNRTWECFRYESVIKGLCEKLRKAKRVLVEDMLKKRAQREHEEAEKFVEAFSNVVGKLGEEKRKKLAETVGVIETEGQAKAAMAMATLMSVM